MSNTTLFLAIYGSVISTLALSWNIVQQIKGKKGKIRITPTLNTKIPISNAHGIMRSFTSLDISVVNLSEKTRYVKQPQFELDQKMNKFMNLLNLDNPVKYPVQLNRGEEFSTGFNLDNLDKDDLDKITAKRFRIRIIDTHGKEYKSKWYSTIDYNLKKR